MLDHQAIIRFIPSVWGGDGEGVGLVVGDGVVSDPAAMEQSKNRNPTNPHNKRKERVFIVKIINMS